MLDLNLNFPDEIIFFDTVLVIDVLVPAVSLVYLNIILLSINLTSESLSNRGRASFSFVRGSLRADRGFQFFRRPFCALVDE